MRLPGVRMRWAICFLGGRKWSGVEGHQMPWRAPVGAPGTESLKMMTLLGLVHCIQILCVMCSCWSRGYPLGRE